MFTPAPSRSVLTSAAGLQQQQLCWCSSRCCKTQREIIIIVIQVRVTLSSLLTCSFACLHTHTLTSSSAATTFFDAWLSLQDEPVLECGAAGSPLC